MVVVAPLNFSILSTLPKLAVIECHSWCAPCMLLAPVIDQVANEYDGRLKASGLTYVL